MIDYCRWITTEDAWGEWASYKVLPRQAETDVAWLL